MPGNFLLEDAMVTCPFGGLFQVIKADPGPTVGGLRVLTMKDKTLVPKVPGILCKKPPLPTPPATPPPCTCTKCIWQDTSAKVSIGIEGNKALLVGAQAATICPKAPALLTALSPKPTQVFAT